MLNLGGVKVASIYFGSIMLDGGSMFGVVPRSIWEKLLPPVEGNLVSFAMRGIVIFDGDKKIVVDAGAGKKYSDKQMKIFGFTYPEGDIESSLNKIGLNAEDITDAIITHLHFDHAGGFTFNDDEGNLKLQFPNAKHYLQEEQFNEAKNPNLREKSSILEENWKPILDSDLLRLVKDDERISEHVSVKKSDGHTKGMQTVWVKGDEKKLVFLSDLIPTSAHLPINYTMGFDMNIEKIMQERIDTIDRIISENWIAAFEHDPNLIACYVKQGRKHPEPAAIVEF